MSPRARLVRKLWGEAAGVAVARMTAVFDDQEGQPRHNAFWGDPPRWLVALRPRHGRARRYRIGPNAPFRLVAKPLSR